MYFEKTYVKKNKKYLCDSTKKDNLICNIKIDNWKNDILISSIKLMTGNINVELIEKVNPICNTNIEIKNNF